jgi:tol-pal system protein YbgF
MVFPMMILSIKPVVWIVCAVTLIFSGCAASRDVVRLNSRMTVLEKNYKELLEKNTEIFSTLENYSEKRAAEDRILRSQSADLRVLVEKLREENRLLKGKTEELGMLVHSQGMTIDVKQELKSFDNRIEANANRVVRLEQYMDLEPSEKIAVPAFSETSEETASPDLDLYAFAKCRLDQGDYETARSMFARLLQQYPESENVDNAQFWIGESYYQEKWYDKAILEYQEVIEKYPKGNKVAAAYLKQGFSFEKIGDKTNARLVLEELIRKYPETREAQIAGDKLKRMK